ncbi:MAG: ABC transporter permease [Anaerolineae bacterium]|nr:ABC transporter permease [Anaerolineae bacterium]MCB0181207.1 ABC transporter permease [Anaerolineae bacterium]MCB0225851.1 ABC transporter permease [Anaerolineae bacterium]
MQPLIAKRFRFFIRISAFLLKEMLEIMRQPLLLLTLVAGPFLILLFFGIGYRNDARALRTIFVLDDNDSAVAKKLDEYAKTLGPQLIFAGKTTDLTEAQDRLRQGEVDLVAQLPNNIYNTILNNQQAVFHLFHNEVDPFQVDYINVFARVYINEVNRRVLRLLTSEGQIDLSQAQDTIDAAKESADSLSKLLQRCAETLAEAGRGAECDSNTAMEYTQDLSQKTDELSQIIEQDLRFEEALQREFGDGESTPDAAEDEITLRQIRDRLQSLERFADDIDQYEAQLETLTKLDTDLDGLEARMQDFLNIDPNILVSPFRSEVSSIATVQYKVNDFFAPAVIVLLLQHLILTFAALSMVRERQLGSMELFFVAPLSALETLIGKYISYLIFGAVLAAVLLSLIVFGMGVPMLGSWLSVSLVVLAVLFASLGIGFIISLISQTDTQAVQYAMIVLLTSVFFSGFLLGLNTLWQPVRIISWTLPATYGILLLRDIMLRGTVLDLSIFMPLVAFGAGLFILAWWLLRRSMQKI